MTGRLGPITIMNTLRFLLTFCLAAPMLAQDPPEPWERMRSNDRDGDSRISRDEFRGSAQIFERLDADRDGFITREEARAMRGRLGKGPGRNEVRGMSGRTLVARVDANDDGAVSFREWEDFFKKGDENGDEILQPEEWQAALRGQPFSDHAPTVGTRAPKVKVKALGDDRDVDLSEPKRTTVLIFGSYT